MHVNVHVANTNNTPPTSQRRKFKYSKTHVSVWVVVSRYVETERFTAGMWIELDETSNDSQTGQRYATDVVGRHQNVPIHLADVVQERQVNLRPGCRADMHELQIRCHRRTVLVHIPVEQNPPMRLTGVLILNTELRSQTLYTDKSRQF